MYEKTLEFGYDYNKHTSFLSIDSMYGFFVQDKWYPSVRNYVVSNMYKGTEYEERIRLLCTSLSVRCIPIYLRKTQDISTLLYIGIRAKFDNNPRLIRKLLDTDDAKLVCKDTTDVHVSSKISEILTTLRDEYSTKIGIHLSSEDVSSGELTSSRKIMVDTLIKLVTHIRKEERQASFYNEMFEDTIYSIIKDESLGKNLALGITEKVMNTKWTDVYAKMPNKKLLYDNIKKYISEDVRCFSMHIVIFIDWYERCGNDTLDTENNIRFIKRKVPYRP